MVAFFSGFSCLVTLPYLIFDFHPMSGMQLVYLLFAGLAAAGGQFSITAAYFHAPAKEISVYDYSQILFSAAMGFIVFGQIPDVLSWIGYALICAMAVAMFFTITEKPVDSQACVLYNSLRTEGRSELIIKVSVIIPVYNAESFLRPCLNSVISQNYKDSEIILIENGSEDGSRTICEEYAERFENIRIITETQRGTAMARQRGLDVCKGKQ